MEAANFDYLISLDKMARLKKDYQISKVNSILNEENLFSLSDLTKQELNYLEKQQQTIKGQDINQHKSR